MAQRKTKVNLTVMRTLAPERLGKCFELVEGKLVSRVDAQLCGASAWTRTISSIRSLPKDIAKADLCVWGVCPEAKASERFAVGSGDWLAKAKDTAPLAVRRTNAAFPWSKVRIPGYSATYSSDIRPPVPGYPATFDTLL